jgi:hypothetical protein
MLFAVGQMSPVGTFRTGREAMRSKAGFDKSRRIERSSNKRPATSCNFALTSRGLRLIDLSGSSLQQNRRMDTVAMDSLKVLDPKWPIREADVPIVVKRELILGIADIERAFPSLFFVCSALGSIHTFKGS